MMRTPVEIETRRRIMVSIWAYAYEFEDVSIVSDARFDIECYCVDLKIATNKPIIDCFFHGHFDPCTGQWIYHHPELHKIAQLYERFYKCH